MSDGIHQRMIMSQEVKFCLNCGLSFLRQWNKNLDLAYINKDNCCKKCEIAYCKKEIRRAKKCAPRHGVLA